MQKKIIAIINKSSEPLSFLLMKYYPKSSKRVIIEKVSALRGKETSWASIFNMASRRKIERVVREKNGVIIPLFKWTEEKDELLMTVWTSGLSNEETTLKFLTLFGFSKTDKNKVYCWKALKDRHCSLNKTLTKSKKTKFSNWGLNGKAVTSTEEKLLKMFYHTVSSKDLKLIFWDRKKQNIWELGCARGLSRPKNWSEEQLSLLKNTYAEKGASYIAPLVGKNINAIRALAWKKNLKRKPSKISRSNNLSPAERKTIKSLYMDAQLHELYFSLPRMNLQSIHYHAKKNCKLPRRYNHNPALINTPKKISSLIVRANRQLSKLAGHTFSRMNYLEIRNRYSDEEIAQIIIAENTLFNEYFEKIQTMAKKYITYREFTEFQSKDDAALELAQDAFYASFEFVINWTVTDFLEVAEYYLENKTKFRKLGFYISNTKLLDSRDLSVSSMTNSYGEPLPESYFFPSVEIGISNVIEPDDIFNFLSLIKNILAYDDFFYLYRVSENTQVIEQEANTLKYKNVLASISSNEEFISYCEKIGFDSDFISRIAFMFFRNLPQLSEI